MSDGEGTGWQQRLAEVLHRAESRLDAVRRSVGEVIAPGGPARPLIYRGLANPTQARLLGRVVHDTRETDPAAGDSPFRNLLSAVRRFESDEVAGARVRLEYGSAMTEVTTDGEGYFDATIEGSPPVAGGHWQPVTGRVLEPAGTAGAGFVLLPPAGARFAVISDLDDTVIRTGATSLPRMAFTTLFGNSRTRLPYRGVAEFYRALVEGPTEGEANPICYVSSGPWNLHEFLIDFLEHRGVPLGPIQLRDWGTGEQHLFSPGHMAHKMNAIRRVAEHWPDLPLILVGDSGQHDPEVYLEAARTWRGRVLAIYIREVTGPERRVSVGRLRDAVREAGAEMVLTPDTLGAARHAADHGWIDPARLAGIGEEAVR